MSVPPTPPLSAAIIQCGNATASYHAAKFMINLKKCHFIDK